ncbi:nucleotidyltransferase domain-containing protein [Actinoplanes xinjiangensis]|uniref:Nucleotidyltransferase-like protein n=1 Tax=Actinoplanes xinjiangensis TaxID=512350 RepID=A0A316ELL4_9ACTN|nr:nucleotidyltransferase domain-containing protein [Actinoplanes xinjiangensis]PWK31696.1 nucleotidyltransferase-like protein [Actinoplanes xinjiangensis]GIF43931.1 nucleotidyltransferase [Actinoplanes xinjiangensis]
MSAELPVLTQFGTQLKALGWISDLLVAGSAATGDYVAGVSDLDLVAVTNGPVDDDRLAVLSSLHRQVDQSIGAGLKLGCAYVDVDQREPVQVPHPTWTHGVLVHRIVSAVTRAELVRYGYAVFGRAPQELFPAMNGHDIREAARAELDGYWSWAVRRPWIWLDPVIADLGLTSMARGRHALRTGDLLTKTRAIEQAAAPAWLIDQLRARRRGEDISSPRLRTAWIAWRDARRTTRIAQGRISHLE